jgi:hypothetical protein
MNLRSQVKQITDRWVASGGNKSHRKRQRVHMDKFAAHAEASGAREVGQVGGRTVISFWKALRAGKRHSLKTQMDYWGSINELWQLWGKVGEPPRPRPLATGEQKGGSRPEEGGGA